MKTRARWVGAVVATSLLAAVAMYRPDQALRVAGGLAAHHVCSMTFVGRQDPDATYRELVAPMIGGFASKLLRVHVDRASQRVEVDSLLSGIISAAYAPGYGCRLDLPDNRTLPAAEPLAFARSTGADPAHLVLAPDPAIAAALDRVFAEHAGQPAKRVKAVVIVKDGHIVAERYAPAFGVDSPLLSYSVAKSFTNALVGILAKQGRVNMRGPLAEASWGKSGDVRGRITLEDLLRMRSGLDAEEAESPFSPVAQMEFLHADMAGFAAARPGKEAPGARFEYTSANTVLLNRLVGRVVGGGPAGLREFARRELFNPLGMGEVTMEVDGAGTFVGSTYLYATARDYARFGALYLDDGIAPDGRRILPEGWVAWSRRSTLGTSYGAGFWTNDGSSHSANRRVEAGFPRDGFYASGVMGQRIYIVPSDRLVIVRFGYSAPPDFGIEDDLMLIKATREAANAPK